MRRGHNRCTRAELSTVDEAALERTLNEWVPRGWRFEGVQFAMRESSKRPAMGFVFFTRPGSPLVEQALEPAQRGPDGSEVDAVWAQTQVIDGKVSMDQPQRSSTERQEARATARFSRPPLRRPFPEAHGRERHLYQQAPESGVARLGDAPARRACLSSPAASSSRT